MTRRFILSLIIILSSLCAVAADTCPAPEKGSQADRQRWMQEMQQHQNDFIAKELGLTDKQRADFMTVYNQMRQECFDASRAARQKAKELRQKGDAATDADYEAATKAYLESRQREASIISNYYKKFGHILSRKQLFMLEGAERKFDRLLMEQRPGGAHRKAAAAAGERQRKGGRQ